LWANLKTNRVRSAKLDINEKEGVMILKSGTKLMGAILLCIAALSTDGYGDELFAWGDPALPVVSEIPPGRDFVRISAQGGRDYGWALALRSDGTIVAWGVESEGRIAETPTEGGFVDVGTSEWGGLGLRGDGTIAVWGDDRLSVQPPSGNNFVAISAGRAHMLALRSDGTIEAWGNNVKGNIADAPSDGPYLYISTGRDHSLAIRADGTVVGWGEGVERLLPMPSDKDFVAIVPGWSNGVGIKIDGSLKAWGMETELLNEVPSGNDFTAVDIGVNTAVALRSDGALVSWGYETAISAVPTGRRFTAISTDYESDAFAIALAAADTPATEAQEDIENLIDQVDELMILGAVLPADGNSLRAKLNAAAKALPEDPAAAIESLRAFINQVRAFVRTGRLTETQGQQLIEAAQAIIDEISN
jgi:hypothetical protein